MDYKKLIKNRETRLAIGKLFCLIPTKLLLKIEFRIKLGKHLNLDNPKTMNEKLQWLKVYNRNSLYTQMADKLAVRELVRQRLVGGGANLVPILGSWDSYDDIDFGILPECFVLKCTHDSGSVRLIKRKEDVNHNELRKFYSFRLSYNPYSISREWPYKNVPHKIIAEEMLGDGNSVINVYKFFLFNGEPKIIQVIMNDKQANETVDYYDLDWNRQNIVQTYPNSVDGVPRPHNLEEMIEICKKLSVKIPFLRIDLYEVDDKIYFSEYTFFTDSGYSKFEPEEWDTIMGEWMDLSLVTKV